MFPGLHHLHAIQTEGLAIWDTALDRLFTSNPFLIVATADGPGMAFLTSLVSHHGKMGCRLYLLGTVPAQEAEGSGLGFSSCAAPLAEYVPRIWSRSNVVQ
ncbi:uncharacterized protein EDB91DRAFT_1059497 [Suillus paluster]|uniref:uncharacterized protein n=1 Tax=Suillus paluster TaxID=48578 RepID=UPI001B8826EF|nr:uncharacterized protein EDB91DRAFT_1059497 [Suillus paluster]KAG1730374.1 hypothetical protein EDB91DRAFT_1059497 [Suillus paluster]